MHSDTEISINLRKAMPEDLENVLSLYKDVVGAIPEGDYNNDQLQVWRHLGNDRQRWDLAIRDQFFIVAEHERRLIGFGSLKGSYYLNLMYVDSRYWRKKVASRIYGTLESEALQNGASALISDVSLTALPFFRSRGFISQRENRKILNGIEIVNFRMLKRLHLP